MEKKYIQCEENVKITINANNYIKFLKLNIIKNFIFLMKKH